MRDFKTKPTTEFGTWLYNQMKARNYSCEGVAMKLRTCRQTVYNHIVGKTTPTYIWIMAYCQIFNNDPNKIWKLVKKEES
jgi:hypothetical protein